MTDPGLALILFYLMSPKVAQLYSVQQAQAAVYLAVAYLEH